MPAMWPEGGTKMFPFSGSYTWIQGKWYAAYCESRGLGIFAMPSLPSSSAESRIAKRYLLFSQCEITASWIAESVWPGAQTREISGMSLKTCRPVRRPGPSSLPMYSAGLGAALPDGAAEGAGAAAGLPPSAAFFDSASFFSVSLAACSDVTVLGETLQTKALVPPLLKNP